MSAPFAAMARGKRPVSPCPPKRPVSAVLQLTFPRNYPRKLNQEVDPLLKRTRSWKDIYNLLVLNGELNGLAFKTFPSWKAEQQCHDNGGGQKRVKYDNSHEGVAAREKRQCTTQKASDLEVQLCTAYESADGVMGNAGGASDVFLYTFGIQLRCINLEGGRSNIFKIGNAQIYNITVCLDMNAANHNGIFVSNIVITPLVDEMKSNPRIVAHHTLTLEPNEAKGVFVCSAASIDELMFLICIKIGQLPKVLLTDIFQASPAELDILRDNRGYPPTKNWELQHPCNFAQEKGDVPSTVKGEVTEHALLIQTVRVFYPWNVFSLAA